MSIGQVYGVAVYDQSGKGRVVEAAVFPDRRAAEKAFGKACDRREFRGFQVLLLPEVSREDLMSKYPSYFGGL